MHKMTKTARILTYIMISFLCLFYTLQIRFTSNSSHSENVFVIEFEYPGTDPQAIEETIVLPFENYLKDDKDILETRSTSEYGKGTFRIVYPENVNVSETFVHLSEISEKLYETLPENAQHPVLYSSDTFDNPDFLLVFTSKNLQDLHAILEKKLKPQLESISSVTQVLVSGGTNKEIHIQIESEKASGLGLFPWNISESLNESLFLPPEFSSRKNSFIYNYKVESTRKSISEIMWIPVDSPVTRKPVFLQDFSSIKEASSRKTSIVRINGEECISLSIRTENGTNPLIVSKKIRQCLSSFENPLDYRIIFDAGKRNSMLMKKVFSALIQSIILTFIVIMLVFNSPEAAFSGMLFILTCILWTFGIFGFFRIPVNEETISAITISIGLIGDNALFVSEIFLSKRMKSISFSHAKTIFLSTLTTIIITIPLFYLNRIMPGLRLTCLTVSVSLTVSFLLSVFYHPMLLEFSRIIFPETFFKTGRFSFKNKFPFMRKILFHHQEKKIFLLLLFSSISMLFLIPKNISQLQDEKILSFQIEFNPEKKPETVDHLISKFMNAAGNSPFAEYIKSESTRGTAFISMILKDKTNRSDCIRHLKMLEHLLPEGNLILPSERKDKKGSAPLEIIISGKVHSKCREYAKKVYSDALSIFPESTILLNFKEEEKCIDLIPDRTLLLKNNLDPNELGAFLRWYLFNPVGVKWTKENEVIDVRLGLQKYPPEFSDLKKLFFPVCQTTSSSQSFSQLPAQSFFSIEEIRKPSRLYRYNYLPCASFTIDCPKYKTERLISLCKEKLFLPASNGNYFMQFERKASILKNEISEIIFVLFISIITIYLLISMFNEKPLSSFLILITLPLSLFLPLLFIFITRNPLENGDIAAMIFLSGISVNNSIIITDSEEILLNRKVRSRIKSILSSSLTNLSGSLPVMIFSDSGFSRTLSFFMFWGTIGCTLVSLLIFPKLLYHIKKPALRKT